MPEGIRINQITAGHAKEFHEKLKARGIATTTIYKRIQFARQFMHDAVDWKIIDENPFSKVRTQRSTVKVNEFVPREVVDKLMKKANPVWKVILGLSRYGGLRTPSETLSLRWEDIDWEMNRMSIPEPKVERQTELQREFPLHVVCSWLGNSPRIAQQSYLLVTEDDFAKAAGVQKVMV